jgi:hypothetical protein
MEKIILMFKGKGRNRADYVQAFSVPESDIISFIKKNTDKESKYWKICVEYTGGEIDTHFDCLSEE